MIICFGYLSQFYYSFQQNDGHSPYYFYNRNKKQHSSVVRVWLKATLNFHLVQRTNEQCWFFSPTVSGCCWCDPNLIILQFNDQVIALILQFTFEDQTMNLVCVQTVYFFLAQSVCVCVRAYLLKHLHSSRENVLIMCIMRKTSLFANEFSSKCSTKQFFFHRI